MLRGLEIRLSSMRSVRYTFSPTTLYEAPVSISPKRTRSEAEESDPISPLRFLSFLVLIKLAVDITAFVVKGELSRINVPYMILTQTVTLGDK